jgi:hypothetical protein
VQVNLLMFQGLFMKLSTWALSYGLPVRDIEPRRRSGEIHRLNNRSGLRKNHEVAGETQLKFATTRKPRKILSAISANMVHKIIIVRPKAI